MADIPASSAEQAQPPVAPSATTTGDLNPASSKDPIEEPPVADSDSKLVGVKEPQPEPLVPEFHKPAAAASTTDSAPTALPVNGNGANAAENGDKEEASKQSGSGAPPIMTGALPLQDSNTAGSVPKPMDSSDNDDTVKDIPTTTAASAPASAENSAGLNGSGAKNDVDMKDASASSAAIPAAVEGEKPAETPVTEDTDKPSTVAVPATELSTDATGDKRKITETNGAEEPAEKKQKKGRVAGVVEKVKEAVEDVKEKATGKSGPGRKKGSKKEKKEPTPVGQTLRKTRSRGPADGAAL